MAVWVLAGWRWMLRNIWHRVGRVVTAGEYSVLSCHLTCGSQRICDVKKQSKVSWTVLTHNLKIFSWYFLFWSWTKSCACLHEICFCLNKLFYSCTAVRCVLMSTFYVCSVYIGVGITLQKSSVYLYTAKNISLPSCLVTHGWHISFHLWAFSVTTLHTRYLCMCTKTYYQNRVLEWLIYYNCFRTVLQSELWTMSSIVDIQKHYVIEVKSLPKVECLCESTLTSEFGAV
jgi:hypothetical protein